MVSLIFITASLISSSNVSTYIENETNIVFFRKLKSSKTPKGKHIPTSPNSNIYGKVIGDELILFSDLNSYSNIDVLLTCGDTITFYKHEDDFPIVLPLVLVNGNSTFSVTIKIDNMEYIASFTF